MTENSLLATAAAAMVHRMIRRSKPLVLRPVSPSKNSFAPGMAKSSAILTISRDKMEVQWLQEDLWTFLVLSVTAMHQELGKCKDSFHKSWQNSRALRKVSYLFGLV